MRAAYLLHYLAEEDLDPPEYRLPLSKLLCGLVWTDPVEFEPPVTADEDRECRELLRAVIAHAPILENMSVPGLRGTFLLRPGILATRDGAWLLRVERRDYDIVLERFPWSWTWVKLPWMADPLQVEW